MGTAAAATISDKTRITLGLAGGLVTILTVAILAYARFAHAADELATLKPQVVRLREEKHAADLRLQRIEDKLDTLTGVVGDIRRDLRDSTRTAVGGR